MKLPRYRVPRYRYSTGIKLPKYKHSVGRRVTKKDLDMSVARKAKSEYKEAYTDDKEYLDFIKTAKTAFLITNCVSVILLLTLVPVIMSNDKQVIVVYIFFSILAILFTYSIVMDIKAKARDRQNFLCDCYIQDHKNKAINQLCKEFGISKVELEVELESIFRSHPELRYKTTEQREMYKKANTYTRNNYKAVWDDDWYMDEECVQIISKLIKKHIHKRQSKRSI